MLDGQRHPHIVRRHARAGFARPLGPRHDGDAGARFERSRHRHRHRRLGSRELPAVASRADTRPDRHRRPWPDHGRAGASRISPSSPSESVVDASPGSLSVVGIVGVFLHVLMDLPTSYGYAGAQPVRLALVRVGLDSDHRCRAADRACHGLGARIEIPTVETASGRRGPRVHGCQLRRARGRTSSCDRPRSRAIQKLASRRLRRGTPPIDPQPMA